MAEGLAARIAAVGLMGAVLQDGRMLAQVLADPQGPLAGLSPSDRARAQRLCLAALRHVEPADKVLSAHLRKAPPAMVQNVLRLAVTELAQGGAAHGVVNAAVDIVRRNRKTGHMAGLVNAVLRKVPEAPFAGLPAQRLPRWLRQEYVYTYGREAVSAMEHIQSLPPPVDITPRPDATALPEGLDLPTGSIRLADAGQLSALPGYADGQWWVQDAAAALAVRLLDPKAGEKVLDLCAAPGGKTLQLAAAGADVTALDLSEARLGRLRENLDRTGLPARVVVSDALEFAEGGWDAILLDAPCSASGTIRRHPDLPFVKDGTEVAELVDLQARMIDHALTLLKPGGRLVFCTCSLLPAEGEGQLTAALTRHPDLRVERVDVAGTDPAWWTDSGALRLRPDYWAELGGMDGFFMVRLRLG